jgi:uncharacterized protein
MNRFVYTLFLAALLWSVAVVAGIAPRQEAAVAQEKKSAAAKFEVYKDRGGEYRWRLRAQNRQILASSGEAYSDKRGCLAAIESVKRAAADAPVEEMPADPQPK